MKRWLRAPLLHFLLLGTVLFAAERMLPRAAGEIVLAPGPDLQARADEEILLREALAQGLERRDSVARERLLLNMRFAFPHRADSDALLLDEALRLGMHLRDRVVRLRLCERVRQQLRAGAALRDSDIDKYLKQGQRAPGAGLRYAFSQRYFNGDRPDAAARAAAALAALRAGNAVQGEAFLLGTEAPPANEALIARRYGTAFARAISEAPVGHWSGPYASPYGWHLVQVQRLGAGPRATHSQRLRSAYRALAEREEAALREGLAQLRQRYRLRVEPAT